VYPSTHLDPEGNRKANSNADSSIVAELRARLESSGLIQRSATRLEAVPRFLSVKETAEVFNVSQGTIHNLIEAGNLPAIQLGGRGSRIQIPVRAINLIIDLAMITGGMVDLSNWHAVLEDLIAKDLIDARDKAALLGDPTAHLVNAGRLDTTRPRR
jgi:excisionase family DNA binding protein